LRPCRRQIIREAPANEFGYLFPSELTAQPYRGQSIDHATRYLFDPRLPPKPKRAPSSRKKASEQAPLITKLRHTRGASGPL